MTTMRRPLGTGPTKTIRSTTTERGPRLLPVEQTGAKAPPDNVSEHQAAVAVHGRRTLGLGFTATTETTQGPEK